MTFGTYWIQICHYLWACKRFQRRRTLQEKAKLLSQDLLSAYEKDKISWKEFDDWMEELWAAADNQECEATLLRISTLS
jgi:hypothetical protein